MEVRILRQIKTIDPRLRLMGHHGQILLEMNYRSSFIGAVATSAMHVSLGFSPAGNSLSGAFVKESYEDRKARFLKSSSYQHKMISMGREDEYWREVKITQDSMDYNEYIDKVISHNMSIVDLSNSIK